MPLAANRKLIQGSGRRPRERLGVNREARQETRKFHSPLAAQYAPGRNSFWKESAECASGGICETLGKLSREEETIRETSGPFREAPWNIPSRILRTVEGNHSDIVRETASRPKHPNWRLRRTVQLSLLLRKYIPCNDTTPLAQMHMGAVSLRAVSRR